MITIGSDNCLSPIRCQTWINTYVTLQHDDVIKWKHFPCYWPFVRGIHRWPVNSPHKGQWRGALMFSLICAWTNGWVNNQDAGDLRRHRTAHYDVIEMKPSNIDSIQPDQSWGTCLLLQNHLIGFYSYLIGVMEFIAPAKKIILLFWKTKTILLLYYNNATCPRKYKSKVIEIMAPFFKGRGKLI